MMVISDVATIISIYNLPDKSVPSQILSTKEGNPVGDTRG